MWRDFAHGAGNPTWDGIVRKLPGVKGARMPLCSIGDVEGSEEIRGGDGTVFRRLRLITKIVRNPLGSEGVKITYGALSARG